MRPILAVHGWQDNLGTWDRLIPLLPQHTGVLCIDLPGHGRSSKYPKGAVYHAIDDIHIIKRVVDEYNWSKVSLMGHSLGGILCYLYAALHPNTVDMLIQIDIIISFVGSPKLQLQEMAMCAEKLVTETERMDQSNLPTYTYSQLEELLHRGSNKSLEKENAKYIINRNVVQSQLYPNKFIFSRDGRIKYNTRYIGESGMFLEMAKRLQNLNHLVIRATKSKFINDSSTKVLNYLEKNNPNFQIHVMDGTHHIHLNNPIEVAKILTPFILKYRPVPLLSWSLDGSSISRGRRRKCKL